MNTCSTTETPLREVWDRMPDETDRAWSAFARYRDLGAESRSLPRLASEMVGEASEMHRRPESVQRQLERWSSRHRWRERVTSWDREVDRLVREAETDQLLAMRQRHIAHARAMQEAVMVGAYELLRRSEEDPDFLGDVSVRELLMLTIKVARVLPMLMRLEREALGIV